MELHLWPSPFQRVGPGWHCGADEPLAGHRESLAFHSKDHPPRTPPLNPLDVGRKQKPLPRLDHLAGFKIHRWRVRPLHADVRKHQQALACCCPCLVTPDRLWAPVWPLGAPLSCCSLKCGCWACAPKRLADLAGCWAAPQGCHPLARHGPSRTSCSGGRQAVTDRTRSPSAPATACPASHSAGPAQVLFAQFHPGPLERHPRNLAHGHWAQRCLGRSRQRH